MRSASLLAVLALACVGARGEPRTAEGGAGGLDAPRIVAQPSVVVFWLPASDTLLPNEASAAYDELTLATEAVASALSAFDIGLFPTHADTVYVEPPNHLRHAVRLSGRTYPFGYVLVDPDGVERVLVGIYGQAELLEEIRAFFDLPKDVGFVPNRIAAD